MLCGNREMGAAMMWASETPGAAVVITSHKLSDSSVSSWSGIVANQLLAASSLRLTNVCKIKLV